MEGHAVRLCDIHKAQYHDMDITFSGIVISKDTDPYSIPCEATIICTEQKKEKKPKCNYCILKQTGGSAMVAHKVTFMPRNNRMDLLRFINISIDRINGFIRDKLGYPGANQCRQVTVSHGRYINVEDVTIESDIEVIDRDEEVVTVRCYIMSGEVEINNRYTFMGTKANDRLSLTNLCNIFTNIIMILP